MPPAIHSSPSTATLDTSGASPLKCPHIDLHTKHMQIPETNPIGTSVLLQILVCKAAQPQARQTTQTTLAFGFRVPLAVKDPTDYALPCWLITQQELENLHKMCVWSATRTFGPPCLQRIQNAPSMHILTPPSCSWLH